MLVVTQHRNIATDPRGKITTGKKREGTNQGQALDYFNLTKFPELQKMCGEKPQTLLIILPGNMLEIFSESFTRYGQKTGAKATKLTECDGQSCRVRVTQTIGKDTFEASSDPYPCICETLGLFTTKDEELRKKKACRYVMYLKAFVANPITGKLETLVPYLFRNVSRNSGAAVRSALEEMTAFTHTAFGEPRLTWMKFRLDVKMVEGRDNPKEKFPIWSMTVVENVKQISDRIHAMSEAMGWKKQLAEATEPPRLEVTAPAPKLSDGGLFIDPPDDEESERDDEESEQEPS